jgi:hypothetical protein
MNLSAVLAGVLLLALAIGGFTFYRYESTARQTEVAVAGEAQLQARIAEMEQEIERLREDASRRIPETERQAVDPVTDAQIEAAVAKWMASHPGTATAKNAKAPRNLGQVFLHLKGDLTPQEHADVWKQLREEGQLNEMVAMFEKNAASNPNDPESQVQLGVAYLMQLQGMTPGMETGKIALNADKTFDKALKLNPEHWNARFVKAQALSFWPPMFGKQAEAIQNLETLRSQQEGKAVQDVKYAQTYTVLGNLYSQQGKKDQAMATWRKGAALFPDNTTLRDKIR